jgi:hypothetical protein
MKQRLEQSKMKKSNMEYMYILHTLDFQHRLRCEDSNDRIWENVDFDSLRSYSKQDF